MRHHILEFESSMDKIYESQTVVRREILDEMAEKNVVPGIYQNSILSAYVPKKNLIIIYDNI